LDVCHDQQDLIIFLAFWSVDWISGISDRFREQLQVPKHDDDDDWQVLLASSSDMSLMPW